MSTRAVPTMVDNVAVSASGRPLMVRGERWVTLVPEDDCDERLWEFSLDTGRLVQTHEED